MANAFADFDQFFVLGAIAGFVGFALSMLTAWKKLRGIYAGVAFLGACASMLYASFSIVFTIPKAALQRPGIPGGAQFAGQSVGAYTLSWAPQLAWFLAIGAGLAFAWASSDVWHLVSSKKLTPKKMEVTIKRIPSVTNPAPLPAFAQSAPEPVIEEVFVIGSNSLLVKHMSRSLMSDKDRDVVGSMISAISSFVRDFFFSSRRRHTRCLSDWSSDVCSSDLRLIDAGNPGLAAAPARTQALQRERLPGRVHQLLAVEHPRASANDEPRVERRSGEGQDRKSVV